MHPSEPVYVAGTVTVIMSTGASKDYAAALDEHTGELNYPSGAPSPDGATRAHFEASADGDGVSEGDVLEVCPECLGYVLSHEMNPSAASDTTLEEEEEAVCPACGG